MTPTYKALQHWDAYALKGAGYSSRHRRVRIKQGSESFFQDTLDALAFAGCRAVHNFRSHFQLFKLHDQYLYLSEPDFRTRLQHAPPQLVHQPTSAFSRRVRPPAHLRHPPCPAGLLGPHALRSIGMYGFAFWRRPRRQRFSRSIFLSARRSSALSVLNPAPGFQKVSRSTLVSPEQSHQGRSEISGPLFTSCACC